MDVFISVEKARSICLDSVSLQPETSVAFDQALDLTLAEGVVSHDNIPPFAMSAMDGYAVQTDDVSGPWQVVGESAAGHPYQNKLDQGQAVRISTGALLPGGGGAILLQENAVREGDRLSLSGDDAATPRHIRRAGFDFAEGDALLEQGALVTPAAMALAIMGGHERLQTGIRPKLAGVDSGDELAHDPASAQMHQIPASNGPMLSAMAQPFVRSIDRIGPVADRLEALVEAFEAASDADVIVTSGGASVGDHDLVRPALERWGAQIDFWRIAMKPGKPLMVARRGSQVIIGLPGNPVSGYVTAFLFLLPLLRKLGGASSPRPVSIRLPSGEALPGTGSRAEFIRARLGGHAVTPSQQQDSSALVALSRADALIARPAGSPPTEAGDVVTVYPLQNGGMA